MGREMGAFATRGRTGVSIWRNDQKGRTAPTSSLVLHFEDEDREALK